MRSTEWRIGWLSAWITVMLATSAIAFLGFRLILALGEEDTDLYESPLMLSVARQLVASPGELYGPFGANNPLVLIHAPLYYRLAALGAWLMARAGLHPVDAARIMGRSLSGLGLIATLSAAYYLAILGGGSRRAGWCSVLLIAASPVLAGLPFAVRPDMAGVALQTAGVLMALSAMEGGNGADRRVMGSYLLFGLALCVKQQFIMSAMMSTVFLLAGSRRGRVPRGTIARGMALSLAIVALIYGLEWVVTGGRIWEAAFVVARGVGRVHPAGWLHVGTVFAAILGKEAGLVALLAAGGLAAIRARSVPGRWARASGILIVLSIAVLSIAQLIDAGPRVTGTLAAVALSATVVVIPSCSALAWRSRLDRGFDSMLGSCCVAEVVLVVILSRVTTGAWINYSIQATVFAAVLTARALARLLEGAVSIRRTLPSALASLAVLACALMDVKETASHRRAEHAALAQIFRYAGQPPSAFFFVDRPGLNRVHGRLDLVYDDWLYPVFESLKLAEPRSRWLRPILTVGPVRVIVLDSEVPRVDGIAETLPELGYLSAVRVGPFMVWTR
jgi:hypothetical protein